MDATFGNGTVTGRRTKQENIVKLWQRVKTSCRIRRLSRHTVLVKPTFWENTEEFTRNTNLHALKYVGDRNLSYIERFFFLVAFVSALSVALYFTMNIYEKWSSTPVIIANNAKSTYITEIPFPAVTICNMNQAMKSRVTKLNRDSSEYALLETMCNRRQVNQNTNVSVTWDELDRFIESSTQPCSQMLLNCRFGLVDFNCSEQFQKTLTDEGLCCTYNAVAPEFMYKHNKLNSGTQADQPKNYVGIDWTPERGYPNDLPKQQYYPRPAIGIGYTKGLTLIMNADIDEYYCTSTNGAGFKIILHSPVETPDVGDIGFSVAAGTETRVVITPQLAVASNTLRDLYKDTRQCIFDNELNLTLFRTYSRQNCEMECQAKLLAKECKCIFSYMPRFDPTIPVCGPKNSDCFDMINNQRSVGYNDNCSVECMPACFDLTFDAVTFSAPILGGSFIIRRQFIQDMPPLFVKKNLAVVHFYYMENAFRSRTKEQYVGLTEFLSSTGGLMGSFIGFSLICFVELTYYATIRPFFARRRFRKVAAKKMKNKIITRPEAIIKDSTHHQNSHIPSLSLTSVARDAVV